MTTDKDYKVKTQTYESYDVMKENGGGVALGRGAGLVIERLRNLGSSPDAVARRCVLWRDT